MKSVPKRGQRTAGSHASGYAILLLILCFAAYANSIAGAFVWDDEFQVVRNETIRSFSNLPRAFDSSLWSFMYSEGGSANSIFKRYYRPIHTVIYMVAYKIGGLQPPAYHLLSVTLHAGATVAVYLLCLALAMEAVVAFLAAGLFAVHPVHSESVAWIAGVGDPACALFYFTGLCLFVAHVKRRKTALLWASAVCFLGAVLSKEIGITFPDR